MEPSHELMRAFSEVGPEMLGRKKWRRLLFATYRELEREIPDNGVGPVVAARRDALTVLRFLMRRCLSE